MTMNQLRRLLYKIASILGDLNAVRRGTIAKRLVRKQAQKESSKIIRKLLK